MEAELRGDRNLVGTDIVLGNGETWCVPSLPLNTDGEKIAGMMDILGALEDEDNPELTSTMNKFFDFMYAVLKVNYPSLAEDQARQLFRMDMAKDFMQALTGGEAKN